MTHSLGIVQSAPRTGRTTPRVVALASALPPHRVSQAETKDYARGLFDGLLRKGAERLLEVFDHSGIEHRHLAMPLAWYHTPRDFGVMNATYIEHALALAERAATSALARAGLTPSDVDHVVMVSTTGLSTPSLEARLANRMGFRTDVRRTPIWGLGCAGGAAGLAHARDFALADPSARVLVVAVELCSLTFQRHDLDRRNLVAAALFGDGAAAAVVLGARAQAPAAAPLGASAAPGEPARGVGSRTHDGAGARIGPPNDRAPATAIDILASRSTLFPATLDVMGWEVDSHGLHVVFSRDIPALVHQFVRPTLDAFLAERGLAIADLALVIAHPGGPKVLAAYADALGLPARAFDHARAVLRECGNMSSPTCLFVLERALAHDLRAGDLAVVAALGPGFASELVLVQGVG